MATADPVAVLPAPAVQAPTPATTRTVRGRQLRPGDVVIGIDGAHRIDHFGPYPGRFIGPAGNNRDGTGARIAYDATGAWRCTVADHHHFRRSSRTA